jgi:hypothetical protein
MRLVIAVLLLSTIPATTASAKPKHWHEDEKHWSRHWHGDDGDGDRVRHESAGCYFRSRDIRVVREYYEPRYRSLPPGLAKKMHRQGHLPPGWEKRMEPLPVVVERELVTLPPEYRRGYIDGSIVVYSPHTRVVVDVVALFQH